MTKYLALALSLLVSPASAGSITVTVVNDAGATVGSKSFTVSTAHLLRLVAAMKTHFGQADLTNQEAINAWLNEAMANAVTTTRTVESAAAASTAIAAVTPITVQ